MKACTRRADPTAVGTGHRARLTPQLSNSGAHPAIGTESQSYAQEGCKLLLSLVVNG